MGTHTHIYTLGVLTYIQKACQKAEPGHYCRDTKHKSRVAGKGLEISVKCMTLHVYFIFEDY